MLDSEPLANTNPLYGKEVGNGCALQVLKNTFAAWEQMLEKKPTNSSKHTAPKSVLLLYLFERHSLPLKYPSYLDLTLHLLTAPASA